MPKLYSLLAICAFLACQQGQGTSSEDKEDPSGGIQVSLFNLGEDAVAEVQLKLVPALPTMPAVPTIVLRRGQAGVRDGTVNPVVWTWTQEKLPIGQYTVSAEAFAVEDPDSGDEPIFYSPGIQAEIEHDVVKKVSIFLRQAEEGDEIVAPYVTAVQFSRTPEQHQAVTITVHGEGGEGALTMHASGPGDFGDAQSDAWGDQTGRGSAKDAGGAEIDWRPDEAGSLTLVLLLEDEPGNTSTLILLVSVDIALGEAEFAIAFNHAPQAKVKIETTIDDSANTLKAVLVAHYLDTEPTPTMVDYEWELDECLEEFDVDPLLPVAGAISIGPANEHSVELTPKTAPTAEAPATCTIEISARDRGLPGDASAISSSTTKIHITLGAVSPCIDCNGTCMTQEDFLSDRAHCGGCGIVCEDFEFCLAAECRIDRSIALWPLPEKSPSGYLVGGGTVTDPVTGLVWEQEDLLTGKWEDAFDACASLNASLFAGRDDWRLPSIMELGTIVDSTKGGMSTNPAIDLISFPETKGFSFQRYLSSDEVAEDPSKFWSMEFYEGKRRPDRLKTATSSNYVRCVAGGKVPSGPRYTVEDEETVRDNFTQLTWRRAYSDLMTYPNALAACLQLGGGWRLPKKKELESLITLDRPAGTPAISPLFSSPASDNRFWSEDIMHNSIAAFTVNFDDGSSGDARIAVDATADHYHRARCVRD